jgi:hypothetical protein
VKCTSLPSARDHKMGRRMVIVNHLEQRYCHHKSR